MKRRFDGNRTARAVDEEPVNAPPNETSSRASWVGRLVRASAAALVGVCGLAGVATAAQRSSFPTPGAPVEPRVASSDFVGAEACAACHRAQYDVWSASTHGRAGGAPDADLILAPFDGTPIPFRDATVIPSRDEAGRFQFTVERPERQPIVFRVDGVVGGGHMQGGGTQGFVSNFPDGTVRFLPFDFARREGVWFCNTSNLAGWWTTAGGRPRPDRGWIPITDTLALADCGDWPPIRVLGTNSRFANCQDCHGSQITLAFDPSAGRYQTSFTSLAINCESCHGPGREHIDRAQRGAADTGSDVRIASLAALDTEASLDVCLACHSVKHALQPGFLPGERLDDFYSLKAPLVSGSPFLPDGRVRTFAYQQNHRASACYLQGSMTCVDCHDPHGQGYRDIYGRALPDRFADGQCLDCHPSKADDIPSHTNHAATSAGSRCVACHMPYLQHRDVGTAIRFARSDHTIAIPRPAYDAGIGLESACRQCHETMAVAELQRQVDAWYGETKPQADLVTALTSVETGSGATDRATILRLLQPDSWHPLAQAAALATFLERYLAPDMPDLDPEIVDRLRSLARSRDLDVQAMALAALHLVRGEVPAVRTFLLERIADQGLQDRALRARWALVLRFTGDRYLTRGNAGAARAAYAKAVDVMPDHPGGHLDLATAAAALGDYGAALDSYRQTLALDSTQSNALVDMGVALENLGRRDEALDAYRRATALNPGEALAHFNLGNLHFADGEYREAITRYTAAVAAAPTLSTAQFLLAQSYLFVNEPDSALVAVRNGLEFEPDHEGARRMLEDLVRR